MKYRKEEADVFFEEFRKRCLERRLAEKSPQRVDRITPAQYRADQAELMAQHSEFAKKTMSFFNSVDLELKMVSDNTIDLNIALVGGLAIFTFMGIGAAASTPMWVTLALYGINHAVRLQSQGLVAQPASAHASPNT